jgi:hypothetical protein
MNVVLKDMMSRPVFIGAVLRFVRTLNTSLLQSYLPASASRYPQSHRNFTRFVDELYGRFGEHHVKENVNRRLPPGRNSRCRR